MIFSKNIKEWGWGILGVLLVFLGIGLIIAILNGIALIFYGFKFYHGWAYYTIFIGLIFVISFFVTLLSPFFTEAPKTGRIFFIWAILFLIISVIFLIPTFIYTENSFFYSAIIRIAPLCFFVYGIGWIIITIIKYRESKFINSIIMFIFSIIFIYLYVIIDIPVSVFQKMNYLENQFKTYKSQERYREELNSNFDKSNEIIESFFKIYSDNFSKDLEFDKEYSQFSKLNYILSNHQEFISHIIETCDSSTFVMKLIELLNYRQNMMQELIHSNKLNYLQTKEQLVYSTKQFKKDLDSLNILRIKGQ